MTITETVLLPDVDLSAPIPCRIDDERCPNPAVWAGTFSACGHTEMVCDVHYADMLVEDLLFPSTEYDWVHTPCGQWSHLIMWRRL